MSSALVHDRRREGREIDAADAPTFARAEVTGVLLCGGKSERMGRDKALAQFGERALIEYPLSVLRSLAERVVIACGAAPRYAELGCELVLDAEADGGPLAGLAAGLAASRTEWIAVLACDMPRADARILRELLVHARDNQLDACLLEVERGTQPMFAVYRKSCVEPVRAALAAGERRMVAFHAHSLAGRAPRVAGFAIADGEACAVNLNTPEDFAREVRR